MYKLTVLLLFGIFSAASAQTKTNRYTISGSIKDTETGEALVAAIIVIQESPTNGAATDENGFFSLTMPEGKYTLLCDYLGYKQQVIEVDLKENVQLNLTLTNASTADEVIVSGVRENENLTKTEMGVDKLDMKQAEKIPVIFGEKDVVKTLQLMPGVKSSGDGNAGFFVRGGSADQNLVLLDDATVYNASHMLGFFSVFNSDALKEVKLYKGTQPANYGGRLSSVLDVTMKDKTEAKKISVNGGLGLIASRLMIETPIKKDRGYFMVAGRRTYADLFLKLADSTLNKSKLYFYDINTKGMYKLNKKNRIYLSGYYGKDVLSFGDDFGFSWSNATATVRYSHDFNDKVTSNTSFIYSDFNYKITANSGGENINITSRIRDYGIKQEFLYFANSKHEFKLGLQSTYRTIIPGKMSSASSSTESLSDKKAWENAIYISHNVKATNRLSLEYGLRGSSFSLLGPGTFYTYNNKGEATDSATYSSNEFVQSYFNLQPRLLATYLLNEKSSIKASYTRNVQYMHLLSNANSGSPSDSWIASSNNVKPELCDQFSLGYFRNFKDNKFEFSVESYYKSMQNQFDFRDGAIITTNPKPEAEMMYGIGRAYGIEFLVKKKQGRFTGWIGYTLSRTEKKIDGINNNKWYAAKQDQTHHITVVAVYELTKRWTISSSFIYNTGNAVSYPSGKYNLDGKIVSYYTERNGYRMPAYIRLDLGATYQLKKTDKFESSLNISCYNALGRKNAFSIDFRENPDDPSKTQAVKSYLFTWVPSITYNFKF